MTACARSRSPSFESVTAADIEEAVEDALARPWYGIEIVGPPGIPD